jgi:cytochrome c oxidase cbb3-type subunit 4
MEHWTYEDVLLFVRSWDAVGFTIMFLIAFAYAYWPRNRETFLRAARIPLEDDKTP